MDGSGNVDLAKKTIDMSLNPKLVGSLDGQGGEFDVSGLGIPVIIKGPLSNPKVYPDLAKLVSSPDVLLQNLSKLQAGIKSLGGRDLDASKILGERTNPENLGQAKGVTGLLNQFALGEHAASPDPKDKAEPGDIVGSIFKELARQSLTQENINPMPMTRIEVSEQIENPTGTNIPVPTLSPRKTAASQGEVGPANDEITAAAASQIVENIIPDEPKFSNKGSSDLLKGLLNSLANQ
jgi:AsmA protein